MFRFRWFHNLLGVPHSRKDRRRLAAPKRKPVRLMMEALEERLTLSTDFLSFSQANSLGASTTPVVSANTPSGAIVVQLQDTTGKVVTATSNLTINLSSTSSTAEFLDLSGKPLTNNSLVIPAGSSYALFEYEDSLPGKATIKGQTSNGIAFGGTFVNVTDQLGFTTPSQFVAKGQMSGPITVQLEDGNGEAVTATSNTFITLSTSPSTAEFFDTSGNPLSKTTSNSIISYSLTILAGASSASFMFEDTQAATDAISANTGSGGSAFQQEYIGVPGGIIPPPRVLTPGTPCGPFILQLATAVTSDTTVSLTSSSKGGQFLDISGNPLPNSNGVYSLIIPSGANSANFEYEDSQTGSPLITADSLDLGLSASQAEQVGTASNPVFVSPSQTVAAGQPSQPITVQLQNQESQVVTAATNVTINLSSTSGTGEFLDASGQPLTNNSVTIDAGSSTASFEYKDSQEGLPSLTAFSNGRRGTQTENIGSVSLSFTTAALSLTAGKPSGPITVQLNVTAASDINVSLTSNSSTGEFLDVSGQPLTSVTIGAGSNSFSFEYEDTVGGMPTLTASLGAIIVGIPPVWAALNATQQETVNGPYRVSFTTSSQAVSLNKPSQPITVQLLDSTGSTVKTASAVTVNLSTTSSGGKFLDTSGNALANSSITIVAGTNSASLEYEDSQTGIATLTASENGFTSQQFTAPIGLSLDFTTSAQNLKAGQTSAPVMLQLQDSNGNPFNAPNDLTVGLFTSGPGVQLLDTTGKPLNNQEGFTSITLPKGSSSVSFEFNSTYGGTPTLTAEISEGSSLSSVGGNQGLSASQQETVQGLANLVFTTSPVTVTAGQTSGSISIELLDNNGKPDDAPAGGLSIDLSAQSSSGLSLSVPVTFFDANGTPLPLQTGSFSQVAVLTVPAGSSTQSFEFQSNSAGANTLLASVPNGFANGQTETVQAASPNAIAFVTSSQSMVENVPSGTITVQLQDKFGNAISAGSGGLTFNLSSSSSSGRFLTVSGDPLASQSITIPQGANSVSFEYEDSQAGTPTLTVTSSGLSEAQQETITPFPVDNWIGGSGNWDDASNWGLGHEPDTGDTAIIKTPWAATITIQSRDNLQVQSITTGSNDALSLTGGSLTVAAASEIDGNLTLKGSATLITNGSLTLGGTNEWDSGTIDAYGQLINNSYVAIPNGLVDFVGTLTDNGTIAVSSGGLDLLYSPTLGGTGLITLQSAQIRLPSADGFGTVTTTGSLTIRALSGNNYIAGLGIDGAEEFDNGGLVEARGQNTTLYVDFPNMTNYGTLRTDDGAKLEIGNADYYDGEYSTPASDLNNQGNIIDNGGTIYLEGNTENTGVINIQSGTTYFGNIKNDDPGVIISATSANAVLDWNFSGKEIDPHNFLGGTQNSLLFNPTGTFTVESGDVNYPTYFEVMSKDIGPALAGFENNFAYGIIVLGEDEYKNSSYVSLVDLSRNSSGNNPEALYVENLVIDQGCTLNLNGLHVYAVNLTNNGSIIGGQVTLVSLNNPLVLGEAVNGVLATEYTVEHWNFSAVAGEKIQFNLLSSSNPAIEFDLSGPSGYTAFSGLTASSDVITLPATANYVLTVHWAQAISGETGAYAFRVDETSAIALTLGTPYQEPLVGDEQTQLFTVTLADPTPLSIALNDANANDQNEVYVSLDSVPTRETYQYRFTGTGAGQTLAFSAQSGTYYILVYNSLVNSPGSNYTLLVQGASFIAASLSPSRVGTGQDATLLVSGVFPLEYKSSTAYQIQFVSAGGAVYPAAPLYLSPTSLGLTSDGSSNVNGSINMSAALPANTLPAGTYSVRVTDGMGDTQTLSNALTVTAGGTGVLQTDIIMPNPIGYDKPSVLYVKYSNVGTAPMAAPLLGLTATQSGKQGAFLSLNPALAGRGYDSNTTPSGFSQTVQFLASGADPGILEPGESVTVPIYYAGWLNTQWDFSRPPIYFSLSTLTSSDTTSVDWAGIIASAGLTEMLPDQQSQFWSALESLLGNTNGQLVTALDHQVTFSGPSDINGILAGDIVAAAYSVTADQAIPAQNQILPASPPPYPTVTFGNLPLPANPGYTVTGQVVQQGLTNPDGSPVQTILVIKGYTDTTDTNAAQTIASQFPKAQVIAVDWTAAANPLGEQLNPENYVQAARNSLGVGDVIANWMVQNNIDPATTTIFGHSLGAQAAGEAGYKIQQFDGGEKLEAIFAADAAGPGFEDGAFRHSLGPNDASEVYDLHETSTLGDTSHVGAIDQYVYGGDWYPIAGHSQAWSILIQSTTDKTMRTEDGGGVGYYATGNGTYDVPSGTTRKVANVFFGDLLDSLGGALVPSVIDVTAVISQDPNSMTAPAGYGAQNFVAGNALLPYQINFENDPSATAPAQRVDISDPLDPNLDWSTLQLTAVGFGSTYSSIPAGLQYYDTTVSVTENGQTFNVVISLNLDPASGVFTASFQSIDPSTDLPPASLLTGFLPPEDGSGRGIGFVSFTVSPKAGLATGTQITNVAEVAFDQGRTIATDQKNDEDPTQGIDPSKQALVTIDSAPPTSSVTPLPAIENTPSFIVSWSGSQPKGPGIASYNIYVSDNGGAFTPWLTNTRQTSATYTGQFGHHYSFYSLATDPLGLTQPTPTSAQAMTYVIVPSPPPSPPPSSPPAPPVPPAPPAPPAPPTLQVPPLLAFLDSILGGIETINSDGTETITDSLFGIPLFVSTFNSAGALMSVSLLGINVTFLFE